MRLTDLASVLSHDLGRFVFRCKGIREETSPQNFGEGVLDAIAKEIVCSGESCVSLEIREKPLVCAQISLAKLVAGCFCVTKESLGLVLSARESTVILVLTRISEREITELTLGIRNFEG